ncbi:F-box domain protein [Pandoravirus inopinatum]|uniref:F-box domain protein n=1 Tax=Pandoravirus inopinatum TaxID=1605721 RepID=A0A0B5JAF0_9VIRU|nr:F-box domain protein [Pandoravirus inopinatum]AJF97901.1 F-box domain protein [Pandoravirus inopinatum]
MAISTLPHEMWTHVLSYCDAVDVWRLALTCREAACTALDPVHILGPGYRRAAARLCTGHMCLARLGAVVDDDFSRPPSPPRWALCATTTAAGPRAQTTRRNAATSSAGCSMAMGGIVWAHGGWWKQDPRGRWVDRHHCATCRCRWCIA